MHRKEKVLLGAGGKFRVVFLSFFLSFSLSFFPRLRQKMRNGEDVRVVGKYQSALSSRENDSRRIEQIKKHRTLMHSG